MQLRNVKKEKIINLPYNKEESKRAKLHKLNKISIQNPENLGLLKENNDAIPINQVIPINFSEAKKNKVQKRAYKRRKNHKTVRHVYFFLIIRT